MPICEKLKTELLNFPVTIVYVESLESLGYYYNFIAYELKDLQYSLVDEKILENRMFSQYHKYYSEVMKRHNVSELGKMTPKLLLILATVALGMGLDPPSISQIIHARPPTSIEKYFQEIGRARRRGQESYALMYYNSNDICKSRKGITDDIIKYNFILI